MSVNSPANLLLRIRRRDADAAAALYDRYAPRLYALALRIAGDGAAAAAVLEEAFAALANGAAPEGAGEAWLVRLVRDLAVARQSRNAGASVEQTTPTPRSLVEDAFYRGSDVATLARRHGRPEAEIRTMLADGIRALRGEFGGETR